MPIRGHGIDLVETERIARMLEAHGDRFLTRCFTAAERDYAAANARRQIEHLAGRFAAKEAVLKALGTGWSGGIAWTDVEIVRPPEAGDRTAAPTVQLHGPAAAAAAAHGITNWSISISHIATHAVASAIAT